MAGKEYSPKYGKCRQQEIPIRVVFKPKNKRQNYKLHDVHNYVDVLVSG
jgi:hypothetical protein